MQCSLDCSLTKSSPVSRWRDRKGERALQSSRAEDTTASLAEQPAMSGSRPRRCCRVLFKGGSRKLPYPEPYRPSVGVVGDPLIDGKSEGPAEGRKQVCE